MQLIPVILAFLLVLPVAAAAETVDNSIYSDLLEKYTPQGFVDYEGLAREEDRLEEYLDILAAVDPDALPGDEALAFYINAYNAWTLKLILREYPDLDSIKDLGGLFTSPWEIEFVELDGETVTLDHIEHDIIRPRFQEPRIHFAINCSAFSCPPLRDEPYVGSRLDAQLEEQSRIFFNDPRHCYVEGDELHVSKILDWFGEDFGGEEAIPGFVLQFVEGETRKKLEALGEGVDVEYLDYDWTLNDVKNLNAREE
jgi:hypothetical protein